MGQWGEEKYAKGSRTGKSGKLSLNHVTEIR